MSDAEPMVDLNERDHCANAGERGRAEDCSGLGEYLPLSELDARGQCPACAAKDARLAARDALTDELVGAAENAGARVSRDYASTGTRYLRCAWTAETPDGEDEREYVLVLRLADHDEAHQPAFDVDTQVTVPVLGARLNESVTRARALELIAAGSARAAAKATQ